MTEPTTLPCSITSDDHLVRLWLSGRPTSTAHAYRVDLARFRAYCSAPLRQITLDDVVGYSESLEAKGLSAASRARMLAVVRGLLQYARRRGYIPFDVGGAMRLPKVASHLAYRILSVEQIVLLVRAGECRRDRLILRTLYRLALRVSEFCALRWVDLVEREGGGQATVLGKGGKGRSVPFKADLWAELMAHRPEGAGPEDHVFLSARGKPLEHTAVFRIVRDAARRAGIPGRVSPHWLRHSAATHAAQRGCPLHEIQATLGHESLATTGRYLTARPEGGIWRYLEV